YTLSIPRDVKLIGADRLVRREEAQTADMVNLYEDPNTGRIVKYTVEPRRPPGRMNVEGRKMIAEPRLPFPNVTGTYEPRLSPELKGKTTEEQAAQFDRQLHMFLARAGGLKCGFTERHERAVRYAYDPLAANVDAFFEGCKDDMDFPCCSPEGESTKNC